MQSVLDAHAISYQNMVSTITSSIVGALWDELPQEIPHLHRTLLESRKDLLFLRFAFFLEQAKAKYCVLPIYPDPFPNAEYGLILRRCLDFWWSFHYNRQARFYCLHHLKWLRQVSFPCMFLFVLFLYSSFQSVELLSCSVMVCYAIFGFCFGLRVILVFDLRDWVPGLGFTEFWLLDFFP